MYSAFGTFSPYTAVYGPPPAPATFVVNVTVPPPPPEPTPVQMDIPRQQHRPYADDTAEARSKMQKTSDQMEGEDGADEGTADSQRFHAYDTGEKSILLSLKQQRAAGTDANPIVCVVDISFSMGNTNVRNLGEALAACLKQAPIGIAMCMIAFHSTSEILLQTQHLTEAERSQGLELIHGLAPRGGTNTGRGLDAASRFLEKLPEAKRELAHTLVMTDGDANEGTVDRLALATKIVYGTVHAIMFGTSADRKFSEFVKNAQPNKNTAHFVETTDDLRGKITEVTDFMQRRDLDAKVGDVSRRFPANCVESTMLVLFENVDPATNPKIVVTYGDAVVLDATYSDIEAKMDPAALKLHVRREKLYIKLSGINSNTRDMGQKPDCDQDWTEVFTDEVDATLEEPEQLLAEFETLSVDGASEGQGVFRSLASTAAFLREVKEDCLPDPTGEADLKYPEMEEELVVEPPTVLPCAPDAHLPFSPDNNNACPLTRSLTMSPPAMGEEANKPFYRSLSAAPVGAAYDDDDEAPTYRSAPVTQLLYTEEAQAAMAKNTEIRNRNTAAMQKWQTQQSRIANRSKSKAYRLTALPVMAC